MLRKGSFFCEVRGSYEKQPGTDDEENEETVKAADDGDTNDQSLGVHNKAAVTIQRIFRGFLARKKFKAKRISRAMVSAQLDFDACRHYRSTSHPEIHQHRQQSERKRDLLWRHQIKLQVEREKTMMEFQERKQAHHLTRVMIMG
ncbi:uncharacterized protein [Ptychodera flava]|uniref:uncharacterized protein n=1 Tax=Ptychodera flava TaxID=63121 RepID=UPI003969F9F0